MKIRETRRAKERESKGEEENSFCSTQDGEQIFIPVPLPRLTLSPPYPLTHVVIGERQ
jgi:hypothetical protein